VAFTLDFNATSRYIGETENVGRVVSISNPITGAKKSVAILDSVQGGAHTEKYRSPLLWTVESHKSHDDI